MARKNSLEKAPYAKEWRYVNENGESLTSPVFDHERLESYVSDPSKVDWRPNVPFLAELELVRTSRGRSSTVFIYRDVETNIHYPLFVSTITAVLRTCTIRGGRVHAMWQVVKIGQNYGLDLIDPAE